MRVREFGIPLYIFISCLNRTRFVFVWFDIVINYFESKCIL